MFPLVLTIFFLGAFYIFLSEHKAVYRKLVSEIINHAKLNKHLDDILANLEEGIAIFDLEEGELEFSN